MSSYMTRQAQETSQRASESPVLEIRGLGVRAKRSRDRVQLLQDVSLIVRPGRCTAVIGESGSGKSTLLKSILRTTGPNIEADGEIAVDGRTISSLGRREFNKVRGSQVALVAQNALAALDPMFTVGKQIAYLAEHRGGMPPTKAKQHALDLLAQMGLRDPERIYHDLPHQLSGGMRQRCVMAMAMACNPRLLLADEPTTALDVITQDRALALLRSLQHRRGMAMLFVTHDIGVAATVADDIVVLYAGRVVERGPVTEVLVNPQHPYTQGLVAANRPPAHGERWVAIGGEPPRPGTIDSGCPFAPRCPECMDVCRTVQPSPVAFAASEVFCHARRPSVSGAVLAHMS